MLVVTRWTGDRVVIGRYPHARVLVQVERIDGDRAVVSFVADPVVSVVRVTLNGHVLRRWPTSIEMRDGDELAVDSMPRIEARLVTIKPDRVRFAFQTDDEVYRHEVWDAMLG